MHFKIKVTFFLVSFFCSNFLFAQHIGNSPYSRLGIGELNTRGLIRNIGMGGTGVSHGHAEFINYLNPALLSNNRISNLDSTIKYTIYDAALVGKIGTVKSAIASQNNNVFNLLYFAFAFPISPRYTTAIGLQPFSSVQNKYSIEEPVENDPTNSKVLKSYNASGGIYQAYFSHGVDLTKTLSAGLELSYLFGSIKKEGLSQLPPTLIAQILTSSNKFGYNDLTSYSGFKIKPGVVYRKDLGANNAGTFFNAGLTYDYYAGMQARRVRDLVTLNPNNGPITSTRQADSVISINMPSGLKFGLSFDRPDRWVIAADSSYNTWSKYRGVEANNNLFNNSFTIALGGEKKIGKSDLIKRKEIRTGLTYTKSALTFNGKQLDDFSLSFGMTIPVSSKKASPNPILPKLNFAVVIGQRGTTNNNLILERYISANLGIVVNDRWFRKRKID